MKRSQNRRTRWWRNKDARGGTRGRFLFGDAWKGALNISISLLHQPVSMGKQQVRDIKWRRMSSMFLSSFEGIKV
uniref:Uncharacterized protein n=1 Tax=Salix viminalis TaxID=40686 RepID=A0A6N2K595_SALVM